MKREDFIVIPSLNMSLLSEEEFEKLYEMLNQHGIFHTRITSAQKLEVYGIEKEQAEALSIELASVFNHPTGSGLTLINSCPGLNQCKYAIQDSLEMGKAIQAMTFSQPFPNKVKISIAGCSMCCTTPFFRDLGIIAKRYGWTVTFGGNGGRSPRIGDVIAKDLPFQDTLSLVHRCLEFYTAHCKRPLRTARYIEYFGIDNFISEVL